MVIIRDDADRRRLTAALAYIAAARIHHTTATGIDHVKAAAVIGNRTIAGIFLFFFLLVAVFGFLVGHLTTSFTDMAPYILQGLMTCWVSPGQTLAAGGRERAPFSMASALARFLVQR
jgi:hypothetical protein